MDKQDTQGGFSAQRNTTPPQKPEISLEDTGEIIPDRWKIFRQWKGLIIK